jgi:hypothetical protein
MKKIRPLRTFGATVAAIAALAVSLYAIQDLWHYWQNLSAGYTEWARSGQGWWQLTCGIGETVAVMVLLIVSCRLLGTKLVRSVTSS